MVRSPSGVKVGGGVVYWFRRLNSFRSCCGNSGSWLNGSVAACCSGFSGGAVARWCSARRTAGAW